MKAEDLIKECINIGALIVAAVLGVGAYFLSDTYMTGHYQRNFGLGVTIVAALAFYIQPELMGKLNKTDDDPPDIEE